MKPQVAIQHDKDDLLRAARAMIINHGKFAAAIAEARARNLTGTDAADARQTWEYVAVTINKLQASASRLN